jgi:hypothetical protein
MLSLVFLRKGIQDFAKQRARTFSEFDQGQTEQQRGYDLGRSATT